VYAISIHDNDYKQAKFICYYKIYADKNSPAKLIQFK